MTQVKNIDQADNINQTIGSLVLFRATTTKVEKTMDLRIKTTGSKKVNAIGEELCNASSATAETVETIRSGSIPTSRRIRETNKTHRRR